MSLIAQQENLREAFLLAVRGKQLKRECIHFREHLDEQLLQLGTELADGSYRTGEYRRFRVFDPKERIICAAPFRDRVAQHAMMRVCHPLFERFQTSVSFASRPGRGTYKAIEQARHYCRCYRWWLKLDMQKYFDSISHDCLRQQLVRMVKDPLLIEYWNMLIDGYENTPGRGLPIGNLTSQYWANHYLAVSDHQAKELIGISVMVPKNLKSSEILHKIFLTEICARFL